MAQGTRAKANSNPFSSRRSAYYRVPSERDNGLEELTPRVVRCTIQNVVCLRTRNFHRLSRKAMIRPYNLRKHQQTMHKHVQNRCIPCVDRLLLASTGSSDGSRVLCLAERRLFSKCMEHNKSPLCRCRCTSGLGAIPTICAPSRLSRRWPSLLHFCR